MRSKRRLIFKLLSASTLLLSVGSLASNIIDYLEVDSDTVLFSTTESKTYTLPACVAQENAQRWSVSLASDSGRAMYSLILSAMAKSDSMQIAVESAGDCGVKTGVERASKINLVASPEPTSNGNNFTIGLYKGDGVSRVGTFVSQESTSIRYADNSASRSLKSVRRGYPTFSIYYSQPDCTGENWTNVRTFNDDVVASNPGYKNGRYIQPDQDSRQERSYQSVTDTRGTCSNNSGSQDLYNIIDSAHPICGEFPCMIRQD